MADNRPAHKTSSIDSCKIIELGKNHHANGNLTVVENGKLIPFDIKRVFYIYDVPGGEERGGHSHKRLQQVIVAISGAFDVLLDDGVNQRSVTLNRPYQGLLIVPGMWRSCNNFSSGSVCPSAGIRALRRETTMCETTMSLNN